MTLRGTEREHAQSAIDDYRSAIKYAKGAIRESRRNCQVSQDHLDSVYFAMGQGRAEHRYTSGHHDVMAANHRARNWKSLAQRAFSKNCTPAKIAARALKR